MIKKVVIVQTILLLATVLLGITLESNLVAGPRDFHRLFGTLASLVGIVTLITAFITKQARTVKTLSVLTLLLIISAGMGGGSLATTTNYQFSYSQMIVSGSLALLTSIILVVKLRMSSEIVKGKKRGK